jgi:ferredoxin
MTAYTARYLGGFEAEGDVFDAPAARTLLESAEQAGVPIPSSCRNGTCRTCISRLVEGEIAYRIEWPGLLAEEKREGWVLPCVAEPRSDVVLAHPLHGAQSLPAV